MELFLEDPTSKCMRMYFECMTALYISRIRHAGAKRYVVGAFDAIVHAYRIRGHHRAALVAVLGQQVLPSDLTSKKTQHHSRHRTSTTSWLSSLVAQDLRLQGRPATWSKCQCELPHGEIRRLNVGDWRDVLSCWYWRWRSCEADLGGALNTPLTMRRCRPLRRQYIYIYIKVLRISRLRQVFAD